MPHVLLVIDQLASGGAPRSVLKLTQALLDSHIRVSLISLSDRVGLPIPEGAEWHVVPFTPGMELGETASLPAPCQAAR